MMIWPPNSPDLNPIENKQQTIPRSLIRKLTEFKSDNVKQSFIHGFCKFSYQGSKMDLMLVNDQFPLPKRAVFNVITVAISALKCKVFLAGLYKMEWYDLYPKRANILSPAKSSLD